MTIVICASGHLRTNWLFTARANIEAVGAVGVFWDTIGMYSTNKRGTYDNRKVTQSCPDGFRCAFEKFPSTMLANRSSVVMISDAINERMLSMYYIMVRSFAFGRQLHPNATWYMRIRPDCRFTQPFKPPPVTTDLYLPEHMYWRNVPNDMVFLVHDPRVFESHMIIWMEQTRLRLKQAEFIVTEFASRHNLSFTLGREGKNHWYVIERRAVPKTRFQSSFSSGGRGPN